MTGRLLASLGAATLLTAGCAIAHPGGEPIVAEEGVQPLLDAGTRLVLASPRLSTVWPGFWPPRQPFGIANPGKVLLVVMDVAPESPFTALPPHTLPKVLRGRSYVAHGVIRGIGSTDGIGFDLQKEIAGTELTIVPMREEPRATIEFLVHESFHTYQLRRFVNATRADESFDRASASRPEFNSLAELERRLLASALDAVGRDSMEQALRSYLAVRCRRYASTAESVIGEELHLERIEGSAYYVELIAAGMDDHQRLRPIDEMVREHLTTEVDIPDVRWMIRVRVYGTGAAIGLVLERLNVTDWKERLQEGATFYELLTQTVPLRPGEAEAIVRGLL